MKRGKKIFWFTLAALLAVRLAVMALSPVFEPSEARYAAISANMSRTGDFLVPRFTYKGEWTTFDGKPPLLFQAGGMFCRLVGVNEFAVRLFPFLSFAVLLALLHFVVRKHAGDLAASLAVGVCSTSVAFYAAAGFCMMDAPLSCCVGGALLLYSLFLDDPKLRHVLGVSLLLGVGMLVKGPVTLALFGLPVIADAAVNRRWRCVFAKEWIVGAVLFFAVASPWFFMMQTSNHGFLRYFFVNENLLRFLVHDYGDKYGAGRETFRGMAAVWAFVVALPWALLPVWRCLRNSRLPNLPRRFASCVKSDFFLLSLWVITAFWCLTSRVPVAYLLPVVPLFAACFALRLSPHDRALYLKLTPHAAALSFVVLIVSLSFAHLATNKLPGASAPKRVSDHHFSYEFYHGPWGDGK